MKNNDSLNEFDKKSSYYDDSQHEDVMSKLEDAALGEVGGGRSKYQPMPIKQTCPNCKRKYDTYGSSPRCCPFCGEPRPQ